MDDFKRDIDKAKLDINGLQKDVKSLEIRANKQDELNENIRDIATSVKLMAQNMENMLKEQNEQQTDLNEQGKRIKDIEMKPAKNWSNMTKAAFNTMVGAVVGAVIATILKFI